MIILAIWHIATQKSKKKIETKYEQVTKDVGNIKTGVNQMNNNVGTMNTIYITMNNATPEEKTELLDQFGALLSDTQSTARSLMHTFGYLISYNFIY